MTTKLLYCCAWVEDLEPAPSSSDPMDDGWPSSPSEAGGESPATPPRERKPSRSSASSAVRRTMKTSETRLLRDVFAWQRSCPRSSQGHVSADGTTPCSSARSSRHSRVDACNTAWWAPASTAVTSSPTTWTTSSRSPTADPMTSPISSRRASDATSPRGSWRPLVCGLVCKRAKRNPLQRQSSYVHEEEVEATIGFEPMHRGFADVSRHLDGVPIVLINVSLRPPAGTVLVCRLVCI